MAANPQLDLATNFVQHTNKNIFLTGKAGTGKTTFLHNLRKTAVKRMVVVAPTGVAAINAGGVTIHSFFQLPFGPYIPESKSLSRKFNKEKINLIKSLDLLVIDEISMVRADVLDSIDEVLRRYKNHSQPFGGVQLLMIGDLHQLSPVVKDEEWKILKDYYPNLYFFNSRALQKTSHINIELKHIYRQSDETFIGLLNSVRENKLDHNVLSKLNQRYVKDFRPTDDEGYITLSTHNQSAQDINDRKLAELKRPSFKFKATIEGDFPEYAYPTVVDLEIKEGAQVMFVKNSGGRERLFYNGKIGKVVKVSDKIIYVQCPGDPAEIAVEPLEWTNIKFELNNETKEIEEKVIGRFLQYPIKLAWAITIHKSQGLTFEKAIIDANAAFAHGQVYVALSRCKSFEGMVLSSELSLNSIKTDGNVASYTRQAAENEPSERQLLESKIHFQQSLLQDLFDFSSIKGRLFYFRKIIEDSHSSLAPSLLEDFEAIKSAAEKDIYEVAEKFRRHLQGLFQTNLIPEEDAQLQQRIKEACKYFSEQISTIFSKPLEQLNLDSDNKAVRNQISEALDNLQREIYIKTSCIKSTLDGFNTTTYLKTKANADIDFAAKPAAKAGTTVPLSDKIPNPALFQTIRKWRSSLAEENDVPAYLILSQKSLLEIVSKLPASLTELEKIKGIGKMKIKQYGHELLGLINDYCTNNAIERVMIPEVIKEEKIKIDTKKVSYDLFKEGKSIEEIARIRSFSASTIEGHLANYIASGDISVFDIVSKIKVAKIMAQIVQNPGLNLGETKALLGDQISYSELKAVISHLEFVNADSEAIQDS